MLGSAAIGALMQARLVAHGDVGQAVADDDSANPFGFVCDHRKHLVADGIAAGCGTDAPGSYIAWLCTVTPVHAMEMPGSRYDIGNLQSYETAKQSYKGITK